jgi:hypothetical protein
MPLKEGKSKRSFDHNVKAEIEAGKPMKQSLAIAYAVKKKNLQKKAEGGKVNRLHQGANEARKYRSQKEEKGVHSPSRPYPSSKESFGESYAGYTAKASGGVDARTRKPVDKAEMNEESKKEHRKTLEELKSMPKPKLKGLADGGSVQEDVTEVTPDKGFGKIIHIKAEGGEIEETKPMRSKRGFQIKPIKHPSMVESSKVKARLRDEMDEDRDNELDQHEAEEMLHEERGHEPEMDEEPEIPESRRDEEELAPDEDEYMADRFAEGGEAHDEDLQPENEEEDEHESSIAATIMARKAAKKALESGSEDEDEAERYADGGEVDIESNEEELPDDEMYDHRNKAILKEHYGDDLDDIHQPEDSNELGDEEEHEEEDEHDRDVVDKIMRNMRRHTSRR